MGIIPLFISDEYASIIRMLYADSRAFNLSANPRGYVFYAASRAYSFQAGARTYLFSANGRAFTLGSAWQ
jgi:hypothetical protein